jgi:hypothetical protein
MIREIIQNACRFAQIPLGKESRTLMEDSPNRAFVNAETTKERPSNMVSRFKSSFPLLLVVLAVLVAFPAAIAFGQDTGGSTAAPTIKSDLPDYPPGATVTLTGSGWRPGEVVDIYVNDDQGKTWEETFEVTADANGNITHQFNLPDWFVAVYQVRATGAQSGVATTSFTDGDVVFKKGTNAPSQFTVQYTLHNPDTKANTTCRNSGTAGNIEVRNNSGAGVAVGPCLD